MDIEYYKTYTIFYKFPPRDDIYVNDAWASVNDNMEVTWTLNHDFMTVIPDKYVIKKVKKR